MYDKLTIQSHKGPYKVFFDESFLKKIDLANSEKNHFIVDAKVEVDFGNVLW